MEPYGCPAIYVYLVWLSQVWRPQSTAVSWWWLEWATRTPPSPIKRDRKKLDNSPPRTVPCFCSFVKKDMLMCILLKVDHNWDGVRSSASSSIISLMSIDSVRTHYDIQELPQLQHASSCWCGWGRRGVWCSDKRVGGFRSERHIGWCVPHIDQHLFNSAT